MDVVSTSRPDHSGPDRRYTADEVMVFAGAGISRASGLPMFGAIRDGALDSLGLNVKHALAALALRL